MSIPEVKQINEFLKSLIVLLLSKIVIKQKVGNHVDHCQIDGIRGDGGSWYVDSGAVLKFCQTISRDVAVVRLVDCRDNLPARCKGLKAIQFDEVSVAQGGCETYGPVQQYTMNRIVLA